MPSEAKLQRRLEVLEPLLDHLLELYPGPWTIDYSWGYGVYSADGRRIHLYDIHEEGHAKCLLAMERLRRADHRAGKRFCDALEDALQEDDPTAVDRVLQKPESHWRV